MEAEVIPFQVDQKQGGQAVGILSGLQTPYDHPAVRLSEDRDLIGLTEFEQYEDSGTDTVIYSFNKMVKLLLECNPNTCEILGLDHDQYLIKSRLGQELLDNRNLFLSKRAAKSFGGYASAQLRRLQNAIARDSMPQTERERHIFNSVKHALEDFERRFADFDKGSIRLYIDKAENPLLETEIFVDAHYRHMPLRDSTMSGKSRMIKKGGACGGTSSTMERWLASTIRLRWAP